ncbi:hypothetical protein CLAIMM_08314 [Cladophialophora immunda]|nr:hypothetical protein CLAIMM_08314 [Cladophialophora immunda]
MIDDGLYDACPPPDLMLAQHVGMPKAGLVAVRTGPVLPASDYVEIKIHSDGVGVNPSECPEPVSIASYLVTRFQRIVGTDIDHKDFATLVYRDLHAGGPGTLFTNQVFHAVKAITNAECGVFAGKVTATVEMSSRAPVTVNDTQMAQQLQADLRKFDDARASYQAAVDMFYAANGNNYKTSQARLKLADHKIREGLLEEAWQDYKLVIEAFERNSHYKRELARTKIKAARLQTLMDNSLLSATLIKQAQALLDELGVSASARSITETETPRMVRIWSR